MGKRCNGTFHGGGNRRPPLVLGAPCPSIPPWRKIQPRLHQSQTKASVPRFCAIGLASAALILIHIAQCCFQLQSDVVLRYPGSHLEPAFRVYCCRTVVVERECSQTGEQEVLGKWGAGRRAFLLNWDYIILNLGRTRFCFQSTSSVFEACDGSTP